MTFSFKNYLTAAFSVVALSLPLSARAVTVTANMPVSASITAACAVSSTGIDFGAYDPVVTNAAAALAGTGSIDVACTLGTSAVVTLGQGANAGGGSTDAAPVRRMASGSDRLSYALYRNALRTQVWGNTSGTGLAITGTGISVPIPVYGSVAAGQNVASGSYADTVLVTVTF